MAGQEKGKGISRRDFLKGLGALALLAVPACRRAQQYAVEPEECPEWILPGEATCYAVSMPWATGAIPMLAVCYNGVPSALQANPEYADIRAGVPTFAQATLLDVYDRQRADSPQRAGKKHPWQALRASIRAWASLLKEGRRVAFLFPAGYSAVRMLQVEQLRQYKGASFYEYDPAAEARTTGFPELEQVQESAFGKAVHFSTGFGTLDELTKVMKEVEILFIFTPADPAAHDAAFATALQNTGAETIRFHSHKADKTAELCLYTVPQTHFLEEWGAEADAYGNLCLRQPVISPIKPALAEAEVLHALLHGGELPDEHRKGISTARQWLEQAVPGAEQALRRGFVRGAAPVPSPLPPKQADKINYYLHPYYADGRFHHNKWLQETYFPLSGSCGAADVFLPGAAACATAHIRGKDYPAWAHSGLQGTWLPLLPELQHATAEEIRLRAQQTYPHLKAKPRPTIHRARPQVAAVTKESPQWSLVIDTAACIGCGACTLACRAENNIPTVGAEQQLRGRDIQWLRIDRYLDSAARLHYLPLSCRQCEKAPCEAVCPVNATVHTTSGLNAMVYPRCWGTRYCSAACPYGARVFNFHDYAKVSQAATAHPHNPRVTVRSNGVMEKCTYCVQRINAAKQSGSGTPQTACQQACPVQAIRLIDLNTTPPPHEVITSFDTPGTRPRTLYI